MFLYFSRRDAKDSNGLLLRVGQGDRDFQHPLHHLGAKAGWRVSSRRNPTSGVYGGIPLAPLPISNLVKVHLGGILPFLWNSFKRNIPGSKARGIRGHFR